MGKTSIQPCSVGCIKSWVSKPGLGPFPTSSFKSLLADWEMQLVLGVCSSSPPWQRQRRLGCLPLRSNGWMASGGPDGASRASPPSCALCPSCLDTQRRPREVRKAHDCQPGGFAHPLRTLGISPPASSLTPIWVGGATPGSKCAQQQVAPRGVSPSSPNLALPLPPLHLRPRSPARAGLFLPLRLAGWPRGGRLWFPRGAEGALEKLFPMASGPGGLGRWRGAGEAGQERGARVRCGGARTGTSRRGRALPGQWGGGRAGGRSPPGVGAPGASRGASPLRGCWC